MTEESPESREIKECEVSTDSLHSEVRRPTSDVSHFMLSRLRDTDFKKEHEDCGLPAALPAQRSINGNEARAISQRRLAANRANAQKSTGPKSARGKAWSRRNSLRHGLRASTVLLDLNGVPTDPEIKELRNRLKEQSDDDTPETDTLINQVTIECTHQLLAMEVENKILAGSTTENTEVSLSNLRRYQNESRRVLLRSLQLLARK